MPRPKPAKPAQISHRPEPAGFAVRRPQPDYSELPEPAPASVQRPRTRKKSRLVLKVCLFLIIIGGLTAAAVFLVYPRYAKTKSPFSQAITDSISVPLYYPQKLPAGYIVDQSSFKTRQNLLTFSANNGSAHLVFTEQIIPSKFDFNSFYTRQLSNATSFNTPLGSVVIGKNDGRSLGSLVSDKTWVLLTTNAQQASADDMSLVLKNLKQY